jgi:hypothetical protein
MQSSPVIRLFLPHGHHSVSLPLERSFEIIGLTDFVVLRI